MRGRDPVDGRRRVGLHICLERRLRGVVAAVRNLSVQREVHEQGVERGVHVEVYKRIAKQTLVVAILTAAAGHSAPATDFQIP